MADLYASIIIDISHENVDRVFQYRIPENLLGQVRIGTQVCVPFGSGNRIRKGYVVEITDHADYEVTKIKAIDSVPERGVTADSKLIELAWWMKERYGSTMNQALKTVLPVKRKVKARNKNVVQSVAGIPIAESSDQKGSAGLEGLSPDNLKIQSEPENQNGEGGADMKVELLNNGPVTICMDTKNKE